jgi:hypothetical protein
MVTKFLVVKQPSIWYTYLPTRIAQELMNECGHSRRRPVSQPWLSVVAAIICLLPLEGAAVEIYDNFPPAIHPDERYVIYSHGLIVEGDNARPVHPEFGVYDFPAIKTELFRGGDFNLIAHHRPKNTDVPT